MRMCVLLAFGWLLPFATAVAMWFPRCYVEPEVYAIQWDGREYVNLGPRRLIGGPSTDVNDEDIFLLGIPSSSVRHAQEATNGTTIIYARYCECGPQLTPVYCPTVTERCAPDRPDVRTAPAQDPMYCFNNYRKSEGFAQTAVYITIGFVAVSFACIVFTGIGRKMIDCGIAAVRPQWNERLADRMLEHDPRRAQGMIRHNLRLRRRRLQRRLEDLAEVQATLPQELPPEPDADEDEGKPTALLLRTAIYHHDPEDHVFGTDDEGDLSRNCVICYQPLMDGDRIGALACEHKFHVHCLKSWLQRRNVCPLCLVPNVATPRFENESVEED